MITVKDLSTLADLVETTKSNVEEAVWLIWAVAQRASADVNIDASIAYVISHSYSSCSYLIFISRY